MFTRKLCLGICFLVAIGSLANQAQAHPYDKWAPEELPGGYGTDYFPFPAEFSYGDLTFSSPYPDPESLTDSEKYIVAGALNGNIHVAPWHEFIFSVVNAIYRKQGYVPDVLTEAELSSVFGPCAEEDRSAFEYYTSPITNELPRLDALSFSPGQVYIHLMTEDEIAHFAALVPTYQQNLVDHFWLNPETNEEEPIMIMGGVFYIRIYGESSVIYEGIKYSYLPANL